jgi:ubiquinol-cytochrome c reductase cytochrome c subunit
MNASHRVIGLSLIAIVLMAARNSEGAPAAAASPVASASPVVAALVGDPVAGKATFTQYCSICHGTAAQGFIGPHIGGIPWGTAGLHAIVRGGVGGYGGMPPFNAEVVTDQNIADIAAFLASLAPAPVAVASSTVTAAVTPAASAMPTASVAAPAGSALPSAIAASGDPVHGRQIYGANCAACHGATGGGGVGPNLHGEGTRKDTAAAIAWIKHPKLPMPTLYPDPLSEKDVEDVAAYVESL